MKIKSRNTKVLLLAAAFIGVFLLDNSVGPRARDNILLYYLWLILAFGAYFYILLKIYRIWIKPDLAKQSRRLK